MTEIPGLENFRLNFSDGSLLGLQFCIAFIMFSVAITIKTEHFTLLFKRPKPVLVGLISQLFLLPLITFLLIKLISPTIGIGMGMILVAVCPGGNVSNFYTMVSRGNVALSVSLTAIVTMLSIVTIPFFFTLWAGWSFGQEETIALSVSPLDMILNVFVIMGIPLILGLLFAHRFPRLASKIGQVAKWISFGILILFLVGAVSQNVEAFTTYGSQLWPLVVAHNALAFGAGFIWARTLKCNRSDTRAICFETGIQNATIAFGLVFTFFGGNGAMAIIIAIWGVWHLIAGATLSGIFALVGKRTTASPVGNS